MKTSVKKLVLLSMLAAAAYVIVALVRVPVVLFLKYEPKDVVITIGGFLLGPMASFAVSALVSLLEMVTVSETGPIGCLMNLLSTCAFACVAAWIYKRKHTLSGAVLGLIIGSISMVCTMLLWNWLVTPLYMGISRSAVEAMLLPAFLPFNLLKAGLNTALILGLYKPVVMGLRRTGLIPRSQQTGGIHLWGSILLGAVLLTTCIVLLLVLQGKL